MLYKILCDYSDSDLSNEFQCGGVTKYDLFHGGYCKGSEDGASWGATDCGKIINILKRWQVGGFYFLGLRLAFDLLYFETFIWDM